MRVLSAHVRLTAEDGSTWEVEMVDDAANELVADLEWTRLAVEVPTGDAFKVLEPAPIGVGTVRLAGVVKRWSRYRVEAEDVA